MDLEHVLTYHFTVRGPLGRTEGSPRRTRQYWEMTSGTLTGSGLRDLARADRSGIEKPQSRAAASVTAMDITIDASFLLHDRPGRGEDR
jgi:hypothetical protein